MLLAGISRGLVSVTETTTKNIELAKIGVRELDLASGGCTWPRPYICVVIVGRQVNSGKMQVRGSKYRRDKLPSTNGCTIKHYKLGRDIRVQGIRT